MSRFEWYVWGWVLWAMFGLFGVLVVFAPYRMGIAEPPTWPWIAGGFIAGLTVFVIITVRSERTRKQ